MTYILRTQTFQIMHLGGYNNQYRSPSIFLSTQLSPLEKKEKKTKRTDEIKVIFMKPLIVLTYCLFHPFIFCQI